MKLGERTPLGLCMFVGAFLNSTRDKQKIIIIITEIQQVSGEYSQTHDHDGGIMQSNISCGF